MSKMNIRKLIAMICIIISVMLIACACAAPEETTGTTSVTTAPVTEETTEESGTEAPTTSKVTYTVTVVDENGAPLAGAEVSLCNNGLCTPAETDENGVATFTLAADTYSVKVVLEGYTGEAEYSFPEGETALTVVLTKVADETTAAESESATETETESESASESATATETETETETESESATETEAGNSEGETPENPIYLEFEMNDEWTVANATVTVPAGKTYYFATYNVGDGMILTANGEVVDVAYGNMMWRMPSTFSITNDTDADVEYALVAVYEAGSMMNPAELTIGETTAIISDNGMGYFYTYTATDYCMFYFAIDSECANWTYVINNMTSYKYGDICSSDDAWPEYEAYIYLAKGDVIEINVGTADYAAGEVKFTTETTAMGTEEAPFLLDGYYFNLPVEAGKTLYVSGRFAEMVMNLMAENATVVCDGNALTATDGVFTYTFPAGFGPMSMPSVIAITNNAEEDATYTVSFEYPEGHMENPKYAEVGENTATVTPNGFYFEYVADSFGKLIFTIDENCTNWFYVMNNTTSSSYGDNHASDDEEVVSSDFIIVAPGDTVQIIVGTADYTEGDVAFALSVEPIGDSAENAYALTSNSISLMLQGNQSFYFTGRFFGMTCTVNVYGNATISINGQEYTADENGIITFTVPAATMGFMTPPDAYVITATDDNGAYVEVVYTFPAGHSENPDVLSVGENTITVAEGSQGYNYVYIAPTAGTLTITMPADANWSYIVNNLTSYKYGDMQWSDSDPVVATYSITVEAGDEIQVIVNTYDPENMWTAPAGSITFTAEFVEAAE